MKQYIISVAAAAVISAVMNMLAPAKWSKYISIVTGLCVAVCIGRPILALMHSDLLENIKLNSEYTKREGYSQLYAEVRRGLEERIEQDTAVRLKNEFGRECTAEAEISVNGSGQITGVNKITVYGEKIDAAAIGRLRDIYGAGEVVYGGYKKNTQKPE